MSGIESWRAYGRDRAIRRIGEQRCPIHAAACIPDRSGAGSKIQKGPVREAAGYGVMRQDLAGSLCVRTRPGDVGAEFPREGGDKAAHRRPYTRSS
jgi:hypothetical protein